MKISCLLAFVSLLLSSTLAELTEMNLLECQNCASCCSQANKKPDEKVTILTFYIQQQAEQAEDFIEMALTILQKDSSLKKALQKVKITAKKIKDVSIAYCTKNGGTECDTIMEVGKHKINPIYQTVRREPIFSGFSVKQEATMQVKSTDNIGELVDSILSIGVYQINGFDWKPEIEADAEQTAVDKGISQARDLCNHINRQIGQILVIEEVFNKKQEEKEEEAAEAEEEEEQEGEAILRFQVECVSKNGQEQDFTPTPEAPKEEEKQTEKQKKKKKKKKEGKQ